MVTLPDLHPSIKSEFDRGNFTVSKSKHPFSAIAINHAHEQCKKVIKDDGEAISLTKNEQALQKMMIAGPEVTRLL